MSENTVTHFVVLFTAQKTKKYKTWQDGTMKYYSFNRKLVLTDEKGYNIDKKFYKGGVPIVGDELEFDRHFVTIESYESTERVDNSTNQAIPLPPAAQTRRNLPVADPLPHSPPPPPRRVPLSVPQNIRELVYRSTREAIYQNKSIQHSRGASSQHGSQPNEESLPENSRESTPQRSPLEPPAMMNPKRRLVQVNPEYDDEEDDAVALDDSELITIPLTPNPSIAQQQVNTAPIPQRQHQAPAAPKRSPPSPPAPYSAPAPKKVRVGLSKRSASTLHSNLPPTTTVTASAATSSIVGPISMQNRSQNTGAPITNQTIAEESSFTSASILRGGGSDTLARPVPSSAVDPISKPFKSPVGEGNSVSSLVLQFPNSKKAQSILKLKRYPKRTKVVPTKFASSGLYRETFTKIILEHMEILMLNFGMFFHTIAEKFCKNKQGNDLERAMRSKGIGMYSLCELKGSQQYQSEKRLRIIIKQNREHYSKYNKDDVWVISKVSTFESSQTFLARSTYFGPYSDGSLEMDCISARDVRVATSILKDNRPIYALRTFSASTEFMMLDNLEDKLDRLPLLPYILQDSASHMKKRKNQVVSPQPLPIMEYIKITREDNVDVEAKLKEVVTMYKLNVDQESVLRQVARSVISSTGWNEDPEHPIVLVHGVYGSGKSFLAAVIIIFIQDIIDMVNEKREPEDQVSYKILVSSMTNVAVDRILQTLLKLGYDHFIRIGSMKKIAKALLPYTSKSRLTSNEELKELEQMLEDPQNTEEDIENISTAIQHFRRSEGTSQIQNTAVVGTTFMSSTFEVFNNVKFPFVLVDESSQLMEPLTMVPLARFSCHRLVMIGDPLQLPPTITTNATEDKVGKGLDKTIFDRMIEMGHESLMLRTQYRCHPRISDISNKLFYDRRLLNGVTNDDRKPLIDGLPTLLFVDVGGTEQKARNNSYWNDTEIAISAHLIQTLISFDIPSNDLGVISLYKEQADRLSEFLTSGSTDSTTSKNVQISTVDAFQGGEKEVIILSTVRTTESQFMDNQPRINVALTRAKRHLIILGNKSLFAMNELWSKVLWDCQENCMKSDSLARLLADITANRINQI